MISEIDWAFFLSFAEDCRKSYIPVIREKSGKLLVEYIKKLKPKKILEIGTAVGYSGTLMLLADQNACLTTIDNNLTMCEKAKQTFEKFNLLNRVNVVCDDALNFLKNDNNVYDFIFIDGPKGQYIKYLPYLKKLTKLGSIIFCDDVLYFGMVKDDSKVIHKKITIVRNLRGFISSVENDKDYESELLEIEDGILIIKRK